MRPSNPFLGAQILLGALAYRSAKRTALGLRKLNKMSGVLEGAAFTLFIGFCFLSVLWMSNDSRSLHQIAVEDPAHWLEPLWVTIAYVWVKCKSVSEPGLTATPD